MQWDQRDRVSESQLKWSSDYILGAREESYK